MKWPSLLIVVFILFCLYDIYSLQRWHSLWVDRERNSPDFVTTTCEVFDCAINTETFRNRLAELSFSTQLDHDEEAYGSELILCPKGQVVVCKIDEMPCYYHNRRDIVTTLSLYHPVNRTVYSELCRP